MSSSLLSLFDNLSEGLNCKSCLDYISNEDVELIIECTECSRKHKETLINN